MLSHYTHTGTEKQTDRQHTCTCFPRFGASEYSPTQVRAWIDTQKALLPSPATPLVTPLSKETHREPRAEKRDAAPKPTKRALRKAQQAKHGTAVPATEELGGWDGL